MISPAIAGSARGGSQDHTAILCAVPGRVVLRYRFGPVAARGAAVPLGDRVFVIGASGITASKAGERRDRYNQAVEALPQTLLGLWRTRTGECR